MPCGAAASATAESCLTAVCTQTRGFLGLSRTEWACMGILLLISLGMFWKGFVDPADMCREDAGYMVHPMYQYAAAEIQAGRFPHWDPYTAMGIPLHSGFIASVLYPLRWPMFFMPYALGYVVNLWIHHFLAAFMMFLFLRRVLRCTELPSMIGAVSFTYCGFAIGHATHAPYFMAYPWFVLAIMMFSQSIQKESGVHAIGGAVAVGLMGLAGAVQPVMVLGLGLGFWALAEFLARLVKRLRGSGDSWSVVSTPLYALALIMGLGVLIAAGQFWPSFMQGNVSVRGHRTWAYITEMSLHPWRSVIQLAAPFYYGNCSIAWWGEGNWQDQSKFVGVVPLLLALLGAVWRWREGWTIRLVLITLIAAAVASGKHGPVYKFFYDFVPMFDRLRNPARIFVWGQFGLAALAALGAQRLMEADKPRLSRGVACTVAAIAMACVGLIAWCMIDLRDMSMNADLATRRANDVIETALKVYSDRAKDAARLGQEVISGRYVWPWLQAAAGGFSALAVAILMFRRKPAGRAWLLSLAALTLLDLALFTSSAIMFSTVSDRMTEKMTPTVKFLQENLGLQRYVCLLGPTEETNRFRSMYYRIRSGTCNEVGTFFSTPQYTFVKMNHGLYRAAWDLCGVKYIVADMFIDDVVKGARNFRHALQDGDRCITENLDAFPRAFLTRQVVLAVDPNEVFGLLINSGSSMLRDTAVVEENMEPLPDVPKDSPPPNEPVEVEQLTPSRLRMKTSSDGARQLVFTEAYHPEWRCSVNGDPAAIFRTDAAFMSVRLPPGKHTVEWWYEPVWFYEGLMVSIGGILFAAYVLGRHWRKMRKTTGRAAESLSAGGTA